MFGIMRSAYRLGFTIALGLFAGLSAARAESQPKGPEIPEKTSPLEVLNAPTSDQRTATAVVRKPPGKGPFPALVYLHGGFRKQPDETLKKWSREMPTATRFLAAGYVIIMATYQGLEEDPQDSRNLLDIVAVVELGGEKITQRLRAERSSRHRFESTRITSRRPST